MTFLKYWGKYFLIFAGLLAAVVLISLFFAWIGTIIGHEYSKGLMVLIGGIAGSAIIAYDEYKHK